MQIAQNSGLRRSPFLVAAPSHHHVVASGITATTTTTATNSTATNSTATNCTNATSTTYATAVTTLGPPPPLPLSFIVTITAKLNPPTCSMDPNGEPVIRR